MAAVESWVLNGLDISSGNFQILEITVDPPKERPEWITAADSEGAALSRQPLHENRTVMMRLRITPQASMDTALDRVGALVDQLRNASESQAGIPLVWTPANSARSTTFDVLDGEITELPIGIEGQARSWLAQRPIVTVEMTCKPYARGTEVTTSTASSSTPITTIEVANVPGDVPALGRLIITDTATQARRHVEWGLENRAYNSGLSLLVDSDNMTVTGTAGTQTTATGAYDPNATGNNAISATVGPNPVSIAKTGNLSHVGTYRVKARLWYSGTSLDSAYAQMSWQVTGGEFATNPVATFPAGGWCDVDLGIVTIPAAQSGTQQWSGLISAWLPTTSVFENVYLDYLLLIPAEEGYGKARAVFVNVPGPIVARDNFESITPGTVLNARAAPAGGTWATSGSAAGDFNGQLLFGQYGTESRTTSAEAGPRYAILGSTNYTDVAVQVTMVGGYNPAEHYGVIARWTDSSNYLLLELYNNRLSIRQIVAGVTTTLNSAATLLPPGASADLAITVYATGRVVGQVNPVGASPVLDARSTALATGGTLATGKPGMLDRNESASSFARYYDNFYVSTPQSEPLVINTSRTLEVRHNDTLRQDSTGTFYGKPSSYRGSRFLVPPGTSRVAVKARRNDTDSTLEDVVTDATQIQVAYTPRYLVVPR